MARLKDAVRSARMRIWIEAHGADAVVVRSEGVSITDASSADRFYACAREALTRTLQGRRVYLLVDLTPVNISPTGASFYGQYAKKLAAEYTLGVIRFGDAKGMTKTSVLTQGIINRYSANIYADLDAADAVLAQLREKGPGAAKVKQGA